MKRLPRIQPMGFGERIRDARKAAGFSAQAQLGQAVGAAQQTIGDWELEKSDPSLDDFRRIAQACGVTPCWLAFGEEPGDEPKRRLDRDVMVRILAAIERRIRRKIIPLPTRPEWRAETAVAIHDVVTASGPDPSNIDARIEAHLSAMWA